MASNDIVIRGAREHNLRGVDLTLPRDALVTFTGVSGSGKSSLAFDTLFREGQRRFLESLSSYARQFVGRMEKPKVESVTGLSPTLSIDQKTVNRNPRSTVGTVTEVYDYLRLLFARLATPHCTGCGRVLKAQTADQMAETLLRDHAGARCQVLAPVVRGRKGHYKKELELWRREGFVRARIDGELKRLDEAIELARYETHTIELVTDRIVLDAEKKGRAAEALEGALRRADGQASALIEKEGEKPLLVEFSAKLACPACGLGLPELEPRLFSFNSPHGACNECNGLGRSMRVDPKKVVPDPGKSIADGALAIMTKTGYLPYVKLRMNAIAQLGRRMGFKIDQPWRSINDGARRALLHGTDEAVRLKYEYQSATSGFTIKGEDHRPLPGILPAMEQTWRDSHPRHLEKFMSEMLCRECGGARLRKEALAVKFRERPITHYAGMTIDQSAAFFATDFEDVRENLIGAGILRELRSRLGFLQNVGLGYLTIERNAATLSGGEAQRVRLATQVGAGLQGVLYVLDEPSIGLHPRDHHLLLDTLRDLRDRRNTVCVVEHDRDTMLASDWLVDVGPGAGREGGQIVAQGTVEEVVRNGTSLTARYLRGDERIAIPKRRRPGNGQKLRIEGARHFNLKDVDLDIPLGCMVGVTGVSGSGKSTLVHWILRRELARRLHAAQEPPGEHDRITGIEHLDKVIEIDQAPIGRTPRSNPATYTGLWDLVRDLYALTPEAQARGYKKGRFSFNVAGGRCEACGGAGVKTIGMQFLADVEVPCEECDGRRFNRETLEILWGGRDVHQVLEASIAENLELFKNVPRVKRFLQTLHDVGLDYMSLGQPSTTISGGEAQRVKLATELARPETGRTLYILDEPTTGLHFEDVRKLLASMHQLVERGNTVLVIEHQLDVIAQCDWLLDLGPEGGAGGGRLVTAGTPEQVAAEPASHTGRFLREVLAPGPVLGTDGGAFLRPPRPRPAAREDEDPAKLVIRGARKNNLRGADVDLPQDRLTVITGVSGSGKTSLAFDTIFAEGQRRFVESLSTYARRFFSRLDRAPVDRINGLRPAIAIDQKAGVRNPRSTVATTTEIHDHLRLLWARIGRQHCPSCGKVAHGTTPSAAAAELVAAHAGAKAAIVAPLFRKDAQRTLQLSKAGELREAASALRADGFVRILVDGDEHRLDEPELFAGLSEKTRRIDLVLDRIRIEAGKRTRLAEALEEAFRRGGGNGGVVLEDGTRREFSTRPACDACGWFPDGELTPRHFSFNHHLGACPECLGLGRKRRCIESKILVDPGKPIFGGALLSEYPGRYFTKRGSWHRSLLEAAARELGADLSKPFEDLTPKQRNGILRGVGLPERLATTVATRSAEKSRQYTFSARFRGILGDIEHWVREAEQGKWWIDKLLVLTEEGVCPTCQGGRLRPDSLAVTVGDKSLRDVGRLTVGGALSFFAELDLARDEKKIAAQPLHEIRGRLKFLRDVGLDYLTLERSAGTLSGGEAQRIRLATQLGSGLVGCMYVLDEPSIGLHPRDTRRLIDTLMELRDLGNTIIVVEHDEEMIRAADHVIDLGPGAGLRGGLVVASGSVAEVERHPTSVTGAWLRGEAAIETPKQRRHGDGQLVIRGATRHNLKNLDVALPLATFTALTGVSGSGKSSLMIEVLQPAVEAALAGRKLDDPGCRKIDGLHQIRQLVVIDQSPIGTTPSSNPATYTKVFDPIREVFAATEEARMKGFKPVRFSFNTGDGRCEACQGRGAVLVEMHFLSDLWVPCESCHGRRYSAETLSVRYKGRTIAEVLDLEVSEALGFFASLPRVKRILQVLDDVGLGYVKLGQSSTTLSGGEAQRVKLAAELARPSIGRTLYLLDEPTTGLHFADVEKLVKVFHRLVDRGSSVLVIEHHVDVIKSADWVIDLGPEGGERGGEIVVAGTPEEVARHATSHTGRVLARLDQGRGARRAWPRACARGRRAADARESRLAMSSDRPLWVQSDRTILFEAGHALGAEVQDFLPRFAELEKSPERFHTYRVTPLSLWNAAAVGVTAEQILDFLRRMCREPPPGNVVHDVQDFLRRYGLLRLVRRPVGLVLESTDAQLLADITRSEVLSQWTLGSEPDGALRLQELARGEVKQALLKQGYPVDDVAGYTPGAHYEFKLRETSAKGRPCPVRPYQSLAADLFYAGGSEKGGSGVIVLPCGAGKTMVAMAVMQRLQCETLVLTTNTVAVRQWKSELGDKSFVPKEDVGEYTGDRKESRPITISTYQILTHRKQKDVTPFTHFGLFAAKDWGLIVYDEVHLLPAPVFRASADLQARRRLGLTATLVREDHKEDEVFSLIGPKRFDMPWKELERLGWIAEANCIEVRIPFPQENRWNYLALPSRDQFRVASENPEKLPALQRILGQHGEDHVLVIGQYLDQIEEMAKAIDAPLIIGKTPTVERERLYRDFREGRIPVLVVSKVGNFAIDLPEANVAVQVSGTFGSRQEEAQRLGRILRPKSNGSPATFYSLVTKGTKEEECAERRQRYLTERGYTYRIATVAELA